MTWEGQIVRATCSNSEHRPPPSPPVLSSLRSIDKKNESRRGRLCSFTGFPECDPEIEEKSFNPDYSPNRSLLSPTPLDQIMVNNLIEDALGLVFEHKDSNVRGDARDENA